MIALQFPEKGETEKPHYNMHNPQRGSFVIQVAPSTISHHHHQAPPLHHHHHHHRHHNLNFSSMKLFNGFRKILMRLLFSLPPRCASGGKAGSKQRSGERYEPPKTSCSSYYSSHSHYNEAISDCIEFFNKSSHDEAFEGHDKSGFMV